MGADQHLNVCAGWRYLCSAARQEFFRISPDKGVRQRHRCDHTEQHGFSHRALRRDAPHLCGGQGGVG